MGKTYKIEKGILELKHYTNSDMVGRKYTVDLVDPKTFKIKYQSLDIRNIYPFSDRIYTHLDEDLSGLMCLEKGIPPYGIHNALFIGDEQILDTTQYTNNLESRLLNIKNRFEDKLLIIIGVDQTTRIRMNKNNKHKIITCEKNKNFKTELFFNNLFLEEFFAYTKLKINDLVLIDLNNFAKKEGYIATLKDGTPILYKEENKK